MWTVCITSVRHVLKVNGYGGRQTKENQKSQCFKGWETLVKYLKGKAFGSGKIKRILNKEFDIGKSIIIQGASLKAKVAEHTIDTAIDKRDNKKM